MCLRCRHEAKPMEHKAHDLAPKLPQIWTKSNDMSIGPARAAIDELGYFEEQLLSPIQPMICIVTLFATGLTEMRGHVANWVLGGPQWIKDPCQGW